MLDAKAEKPNGNRTATIQMSQTSMRVRMRRSGVEMDEAGKLAEEIERDGKIFYVVTVIAKYVYEEDGSGHRLIRIIAACIPNGKLQHYYNPSSDDTIWLAGRNAPTLGEDFRVRPELREAGKEGAVACGNDRNPLITSPKMGSDLWLPRIACLGVTCSRCSRTETEWQVDVSTPDLDPRPSANS